MLWFSGFLNKYGEQGYVKKERISSSFGGLVDRKIAMTVGSSMSIMY